MKLIDADALLENMRFQDGINEDGVVYVRLGDIRKSIAEQPEAVADIYANALKYKKLLTESCITDLEVGRNATSGQTAANLFSLIVLAPFWIISLWPALFIYCAPLPITKRLKDKMFEGTIVRACGHLRKCLVCNNIHCNAAVHRHFCVELLAIRQTHLPNGPFPPPFG